MRPDFAFLRAIIKVYFWGSPYTARSIDLVAVCGRAIHSYRLKKSDPFLSLASYALRLSCLPAWLAGSPAVSREKAYSVWFEKDKSK